MNNLENKLVGEWVTDDSQFTQVTGDITYKGESSIAISTDGNARLNGERMEKGKEYDMSDGAIIIVGECDE